MVSQSVRPGTPVPIGTTVDLVMAPPDDLPVGMVKGTHQVVKNMKVKAAYEALVKGKPQVNRILTRAAAGPLSREDEQAVVQLFADANIEVTDRPGNDVTSALSTLRMLNAFGG